MTLFLRQPLPSGDGPSMSNDEPYWYSIGGLPTNQEVEVWKAGPNHNWKVRWTIDGNVGEWEGDYESPEEALADIESKL